MCVWRGLMNEKHAQMYFMASTKCNSRRKIDNKTSLLILSLIALAFTRFSFPLWQGQTEEKKVILRSAYLAAEVRTFTSSMATRSTASTWPGCILVYTVCFFEFPQFHIVYPEIKANILL